jgi:hypothetical protein
MAKRRYQITVLDYDKLAESYPHAVHTKIIRTFDYAYIAKLLDCQLPVPGVVIGDPQLDLEEKITELRKEA